jgi:hypothetical protein
VEQSRKMKIRCSLILLVAVLSGGCVSLAGPSGEGVPVFASPASVVPSWVPEDISGLSFFAGKTAEPETEFWALRADLSSPHIAVKVGAGAPEKDYPPGVVPATFVSSFVRSGGLYAGINVTPFDRVSGKEGEDRGIIGIAVADGALIAGPHPGFDAIVFYADGRAAVVDQAGFSPAALAAALPSERILHAAGGFHAVLRGGALTARTGETAARHPRSAAGLSEDGFVLYLLVIDGRRRGSRGATEGETAVLLRSLGASEGINVDGGGSTAMAIRRDGAVVVVNTPVHGGIPGRERAVGICLGIAAAEGGGADAE